MYLWGGPHVVYRFALAVLKYFESTLLALNFEDALSFINELPKKKVHAEDLVKAKLPLHHSLPSPAHVNHTSDV